jgi:hypothetical protein
VEVGAQATGATLSVLATVIAVLNCPSKPKSLNGSEAVWPHTAGLARRIAAGVKSSLARPILGMRDSTSLSVIDFIGFRFSLNLVNQTKALICVFISLLALLHASCVMQFERNGCISEQVLGHILLVISAIYVDISFARCCDDLTANAQFELLGLSVNRTDTYNGWSRSFPMQIA